MPTWPAELIGHLPSEALVPLVVAYLVYRAIRRLLESPLSIATLFGVLGGQNRRRDAIEIVGKLCAADEDRQAGEPPSPTLPRRWRRRRRRRRRR
ncbi:hypothetical protein [Micromonospora sp. WMMD980]|uniref:hypothetical protein n=1 Tax=Micromonospora sp. WMMD980 TaxID=3016088 RepID=UPI00241685A2|nr:hypothetical protein [Micromonospora sp. WMMD980]MDG4803425.1 hypothetical protein [Micromonospora sp. WMMD980]